MTVRETLAFSGRCQGVGSRYGALMYNTCLCFPEMLIELARREKDTNIKPDLDVNIFMKVMDAFRKARRLLLRWYW
ncbi:pleiotropic drug resistance protein TUR2-like isoform X2 [Daucus carota subsp. sativus]